MLVDTNVLLRALQPGHPHSAAALHALEALPMQGRELCLAPQILVELWVVMTRPVPSNGLGWGTASARSEIDRLEALFPVPSETPDLYAVWKRLVVEYGVSGKPAHDARLVAFLKIHGLAAILSFDRSGFSRFDGIEVIHPDDATTQPP